MTTALLTDAVTGDAARAVRLTLLWGLDAVVLRSLGGGRVPNVTEGPLRRRLEESELPVAALDPGLFEGAASNRAAWLDDLAQLAEVAAFGRRVGCTLVRVGALAAGEAEGAAAALRHAGDEAARLGLTLAVRNEARTPVATGAALSDLLGAVGHSAVAADWRPADALLAGEDPAAGLAALREASVRVACVGVRDGAPDGAGWAEAVVGEGDVGWDRQLAALGEAGFEGPLVLEGAPEPTRSGGLASSTALVRLARPFRR